MAGTASRSPRRGSGQRGALDQHVARLAVLAGDRERAVRLLVGPVREQRRVARLIELRTRVVGHAAVDRDVASVARALDRADAVERERRPGPTSERPGSTISCGAGKSARRPFALDRSAIERATSSSTGGSGSSSTWRIPKPPPMSIVRRAPVELVAARARRTPRAARPPAGARARPRAASRRGRAGPRPRGRLQRGAHRLERIVRVEPELRAAVARADRLVRLGLDPGRDAHEHAPDAGRGCARRLVERVEHDERARLGGGAQLLVRLVVAVHDQPLAGDPRAPRERELAERGDVGADPLLGSSRMHGDVRERLRPVDDERPRQRPAGTSARVRGAPAPSRRRAASRTARRARSRAVLRAPARPPRRRCRRGNSASIRAVKQLLP